MINSLYNLLTIDAPENQMHGFYPVLKYIKIWKLKFCYSQTMFGSESKVYIIFDRLYQLRISRHIFSLTTAKTGSCLWNNYIINLEGVK